MGPRSERRRGRGGGPPDARAGSSGAGSRRCLRHGAGCPGDRRSNDGAFPGPARPYRGAPRRCPAHSGEPRLGGAAQPRRRALIRHPRRGAAPPLGARARREAGGHRNEPRHRQERSRPGAELGRRADALQHRVVSHRRVRHGVGSDPRGVGGGQAPCRVLHRDASMAPGRTAHRLGARAGPASPPN